VVHRTRSGGAFYCPRVYLRQEDPQKATTTGKEGGRLSKRSVGLSPASLSRRSQLRRKKKVCTGNLKGRSKKGNLAPRKYARRGAQYYQSCPDFFRILRNPEGALEQARRPRLGRLLVGGRQLSDRKTLTDFEQEEGEETVSGEE